MPPFRAAFMIEEMIFMNHRGTVTLETERLVLRRFEMGDCPAVFANWAGDEKVTEFLRWPAHRDLSVTGDVISGWKRAYESNSFYQWAVVPKESGEPVGTISVVDMDARTGKMHIGYCLGQKWWNKGYMTEAFSEVIKFLFEKVGARRIESQHDPENPASGRVMQKCNLKYEGTLRKADWSNRGIVDACVYAILADDYYNAK